MIRRELRAAHLFDEETDLVLSIEHTELDWELSDIKHTASTQYANYKHDYQKNRKFGFDREDRQLLFITPEERESFNDIKNKSKDIILKQIYSMLAKITDSAVTESFQMLLGKVPMRLKKAVLLEIYTEIVAHLDLKDISRRQTGRTS